jgi:aerobic C4-dicarboxylate transport protein
MTWLTMAGVFLAQTTDTPLDFAQQLSLMLVAMITSKGASSVAGAGYSHRVTCRDRWHRSAS